MGDYNGDDLEPRAVVQHVRIASNVISTKDLSSPTCRNHAGLEGREGKREGGGKGQFLVALQEAYVRCLTLPLAALCFSRMRLRLAILLLTVDG